MYLFQAVPKTSYNPDVSPLDLGVFGTVTHLRRIRKIESDEELKEIVSSFLNDLIKEFIKSCFNTWEKRLQEVIDTAGD